MEVKANISFSGGKISMRAIHNKKQLLSTVFLNFNTSEETLLNLLLQQFIHEKVCVSGVNMNNGIVSACATTKGIVITIPEAKIVSNILQIYNYLMKTELKSPQNKYLSNGSYKKLSKDVSDFKVMITGKCKNFSIAMEDSSSKKMQHLKDTIGSFSSKDRADIKNDKAREFECCKDAKPIVFKGNKIEKLDLCIFLKDLPCVIDGDEIGDMSLAAQAKVLRVLQERKLSRVGSDKDIMVDVRVVAATNKNLKAEIEKGTFREDLYHRLSVIVINVPTLDARKDDIPLLVEYFIDQICAETGMQRRKIEPKAMQMLVDKTWTGNIRELRNVVERLLILSGPTVTADDVKAYVL